MKPAFLLLPVVAFTLAACAGAPKSSVTDAATTPLSDLNIVRAEIPAALVAAQKQPYALPADAGCVGLLAEVRALDEVLGPDLDTPATASNPGLIDRGGQAAVGAMRNAAEGVVPFRGWVRKLSGAERYANNVAAAIAAGTVRRAFLKGIGSARACSTTPPKAT
jgi:hypothetical protein